jgi:hypothetical protein
MCALTRRLSGPFDPAAVVDLDEGLDLGRVALGFAPGATRPDVLN